MSGLVFDPTNPDVLYAVKNKSWVFRLVKQGDLWVADTANGWGAGKQIFFPGGIGQPDSEGLTVGADGALYVTTERDNANNSFALNSVLRFDPTAAGTDAHRRRMQWNLTADFPELNRPNRARPTSASRASPSCPTRTSCRTASSTSRSARRTTRATTRVTAPACSSPRSRTTASSTPTP